jgi:hypothetical protein
MTKTKTEKKKIILPEVKPQKPGKLYETNKPIAEKLLQEYKKMKGQRS